MLSFYALNFYLAFLIVFPQFTTEQTYGNLWCQQGDKKKYSPAECPEQTLECFKFVCDGIEDSFVARGCGVSVLTTAAGLPNESCHQAQSICEQVGGQSSCHVCGNKHVCNSVAHSSVLVLISVLLLLVFA